MIVTGALLAESASVVENKLNVQGGVVSAFRPGPDRVAPVTLVILTQPEPGETSAVIEATITTPAGESHPAQFPVPESSLGGEVGFITVPMRLNVPASGRYVISVGSGSDAINLPLNVIG